MGQSALSIIAAAPFMAMTKEWRFFGSKGAAVTENDTPTNVKVLNAGAVTSDKPLFFFLERYMQSFGDEVKAFVDAIEKDTPSSRHH